MLIDRQVLLVASSIRRRQRSLANASCVDWKRADGKGLVGTWDGTYPPGVPTRRARVFRVTAKPIESGKYKGLVELTAGWRNGGSADWRGYASLTRRVAAGDPGPLAAFFREVERKLAALLLNADYTADELSRMIRKFRLATVGDAVLGSDGDIIDFPHHRPGPRTAG